MSTLVIHPTDSSTAFLTPIYSGKGYDVLNSYDGNLNALLPNYERIIMLGHGWTHGLFAMGKFGGITPNGMAIDKSSVPGLKGKDNVYIWCWASKFVGPNALKGFSTGMFISEVGEAAAFGIIAEQEEVTMSNNLFAKIMAAQIGNPNLSQIMKEYDGESPVIQYNRKLLKRF